jgi:hypothetical protein
MTWRRQFCAMRARFRAVRPAFRWIPFLPRQAHHKSRTKIKPGCVGEIDVDFGLGEI